MFCILYGIVVYQIHGTYVMTPLWPLRLWVQYFLSTSQTLIDMSLDPVASNVDVESTAISNIGPPCILCMIARKGSRNEMVGMTRWGIFLFSTLLQNPLIHIMEKYNYSIKLSQKKPNHQTHIIVGRYWVRDQLKLRCKITNKYDSIIYCQAVTFHDFMRNEFLQSQSRRSPFSDDTIRCSSSGVKQKHVTAGSSSCKHQTYIIVVENIYMWMQWEVLSFSIIHWCVGCFTENKLLSWVILQLQCLGCDEIQNINQAQGRCALR